MLESEKSAFESEPKEPKSNLPRVTKETVESFVSELEAAESRDRVSEGVDTDVMRIKYYLTIRLENPTLGELINTEAENARDEMSQEHSRIIKKIASEIYELLRRQSLSDQTEKMLTSKSELGEPKSALPVITKETVESFLSEFDVTEGSAESGKGMVADAFKNLERENPELFKFIQMRVEEAGNEPGDEHAVTVFSTATRLYELLRRQSLADQTEQEFKDK